MEERKKRVLPRNIVCCLLEEEGTSFNLCWGPTNGFIFSPASSIVAKRERKGPRKTSGSKRIFFLQSRSFEKERERNDCNLLFRNLRNAVEEKR